MTGSRVQTWAWAAFILAGWAVFLYLLLAAPGGLPAAWDWVRSLPLLLQLVMWLLFLPWMAALWISQTSWPLVLRVLLIAGLALATLWISIPPLIRLLTGRRR
jgi:hypothetical protein